MIRVAVAAGALAACGLIALIGKPIAPRSAIRAIYTADQADAGRTAFMTHSCATCHTDSLTGRNGETEVVPAIVRQVGGKVPPLAGARFLAKWGPRTTRDLYARMEGIEKLDEETYLDLLAYILQANGAKAGTEPLRTSTVVEIRSATAHKGGR